MSTEVKVPAVGESISSGVVSVWHKKSGEQVSAGDPLFTLETDKVSTEINAEKDGVLQTLVAEGAEVKIGDVVATIEDGNRARWCPKRRRKKRTPAVTTICRRPESFRGEGLRKPVSPEPGSIFHEHRTAFAGSASHRDRGKIGP